MEPPSNDSVFDSVGNFAHSPSRRCRRVQVGDGPVDLAPFACDSIERSSFIRRVCYDHANAYMIVSLNGTYYHYCGIDNATVDAFKAADSMGRFFNASIKGNFDCKTGHVPTH
jgi:hypothetical protein